MHFEWEMGRFGVHTKIVDDQSEWKNAILIHYTLTFPFVQLLWSCRGTVNSDPKHQYRQDQPQVVL